MNSLNRKLATALIAVLLLVAMSPLPAGLTQSRIMPEAPKTGVIKATAPKVEPRADLIRIISRQKRTLQPFALLDPKNKQPIQPDTLLPPLPNGKRLTARQYYDQLNRLEHWFNERGYSLRDPAKRIRIQETNLDRAMLLRQAQSISSAHVRAGDPQTAMLKKEALQRAHVEDAKGSTQRVFALKNLKVSPIISGIPASPLATTVHTEKPWNFSVGDPSIISAYFKGKLVLDGSKDMTKVGAEADAGGFFLNNNVSLVRMTGTLTAPQTRSMYATLDLNVLGSSVYSLNQPVNTSWDTFQDVSRPIDYSTPAFSLPLGPLSVNLKAGIKGSTGVAYYAGLDRLSATGWYGPKVNTEFYLSGGLSIGIAGFDIRGTLTLLKYDMLLVGTCSIRLDPANSKPYFFQQFAGYEDINTLSGDLELVAYVYVPCWCLPPWERKEWSWSVWPWEGYKYRGWLFDDTKKTYVL